MVEIMNQIDSARRSRHSRQQNLLRLLRPRHIAFIGGSQVEGGLSACQRAGFKGEIWVVNPNRDEIGGLKCYSAIEELPEAPDAAMLALSPALCVEAARCLAAIGGGGAVVMAGGFAELADDEGRALQQALKDAAGDLALLGPNCMGVLNFFDGAAIWGADSHMECPGEYGSALISQSGAFVFGAANVEQVSNLGYGISTGNQAIIEIADCIEAVLQDDRVRAIGIYLEGLDDGNALGRACWHAMQKNVPVVAIKGGDTPAGESVAFGHTGAMVVERDLWDAFAQRYGIVEVSTPKAMIETLKYLSICGVPKGPKLSVVTYSGGLNGLIASRAPAMGLQLPQPTHENIARLRDTLPKTVPITNPLDLNLAWKSKTEITMEDGPAIAHCMSLLTEDVAHMLTFFIDVPRPDEKGFDRDWLPSIECLSSVRESTGVACAVAGILPEGLDVDLRRRLLATGVAPLLGFADAMEALSVAARLAAVYQQKSAQTQPEDLLEISQGLNSTVILDEQQGKTLLAKYGVSRPNGCVTTAESAPTAARDIGFPVALKVLSNQIAHKAQVGGVCLDLQSEEDVSEAVQNIRHSLASSGIGELADKFLVEAMIENPVREFIIGIKRHPALGLALVFGQGGVHVEQDHQFATLLLPLNDQELDAVLIRFGLAEGVLGRDSLLQVMISTAAFATEHADTISELDINPVILNADGDAIAADAFIIVQNKAGDE